MTKNQVERGGCTIFKKKKKQKLVQESRENLRVESMIETKYYSSKARELVTYRRQLMLL